MNADEAYAQCEQITWEQARNFAYGIRLLPPDKRRALAAVYAYARRIDDIGDGDLPAGEKTAQLEAARQQVRALVARVKGDTAAVLDDSDPVLVALTDVGGRFQVPLEAFEELIDGCLADVNQATYETFDDLLYYCRCVAGSIGRLSLGIYGATQPDRQGKLADDLGVALQLTNILRDVREDAANGRTYLPAEDLARFGCEQGFLGRPAAGADFTGLVLFEARRAQEYFDEGLLLLPMLDRRSRACVAAMAGIYHRLLERIVREPEAVLRGRVSLPGWEKAYVALSGLASGGAARSATNEGGGGRREGTLLE